MVFWKIRRKESKQQVETKEKTNRWKVKKGIQAGKEGMQAADLKKGRLA